MAARFKFRLESLLKLRRSLEEEAQRHLARMLAIQAEVQGRINELRTSHTQALDSRKLAPHQVVDLTRWQATERFLLVLERRILLAIQEFNQAQTQVASARTSLIKAHQSHLMLQRLKERRQEQHTQAALQEEIREMDELAVLRHRFRHDTSAPVQAP